MFIYHIYEQAHCKISALEQKLLKFNRTDDTHANQLHINKFNIFDPAYIVHLFAFYFKNNSSFKVYKTQSSMNVCVSRE